MMYKDKSKMFEDFGFKLVVINSLLHNKPSFEKELAAMQEKYVDDFEDFGDYKCITQMVEFFENLELTQADLDKVERLVFDGGEEIYYQLMPDWENETRELNVKSVKGFEKLKNLKEVEFVDMCDKKLVDEIIQSLTK